MDLILSSWQLMAVALLAIGAGALAKGVTGVGLPILAIPALASFTSVEEAVVLMVLPGLAANGWLVMTHRRWAVLRQHRRFLLLGLAGSVFGTWLLSVVDDRWLKVTLAVWLGIYLLHYFSKRTFSRNFFGCNRLRPLLGMTAGAIQGASGISAPIVAPYFHAAGLLRESYAFATAFTFLLFCSAQVVTMSATGLFTPKRLMVGLVIVIPTLLFIQLGIRLARRINEKTFHRILLLLFIAMECKLIFDILR